MDKKEVDSKIVKKKLEAFKNIVKNCTKQIKAGFPWFKLDITTTVSYEGGAQKVNFRKDGEPVCAIDFPARDVLTKNAAQLTNEVYSRLYGAATHWKNTQENAKAEKNNEAANENKPKNEDKALVSKDTTVDLTRREAKRVISGYIEKILRDKYFDRVKKSLFTNNYAILAGTITDRILDKIDEKNVDFAVKDVIKTFFDISKLDNIAQMEIGDVFGEVVGKARLACIANKVDQLSLVPGKELVALGYAQQYEALKSAQLSEQFRNLKINDIESVKKYCESIAQRVMNRAGLANIKVTFNEEGALGTYYDSGYGNHSLNINLSRIKSVSELTMTITHELTHATDSAVNQVNAKLGIGQINEKDGTGLINNIQESVAGSGMVAGSEGHNFLLRLKKYCYHINPNERHARENELSSLMFMVESVGNDQSTKDEIAKSLRSYINYQNNTVDMCNMDKVTALETEFESLKSRGALTDKAITMIQTRLDYLKKLEQGGFFDATADKETLARADELYQQLTGKSLLNKRLQSQAKEVAKESAEHKVKEAEAATKENS